MRPHLPAETASPPSQLHSAFLDVIIFYTPRGQCCLSLSNHNYCCSDTQGCGRISFPCYHLGCSSPLDGGEMVTFFSPSVQKLLEDVRRMVIHPTDVRLENLDRRVRGQSASEGWAKYIVCTCSLLLPHSVAFFVFGWL